MVRDRARTLPTSARSLTAAAAISALGMALHTVREFDWSGLADPSSGFIPVTAIQLGLLAWWRLAPAARTAAALSLGITGWFQLIGGALISVLPLPILPFVPEQSVAHYISHLVYGLCQVPLIVVARQAMAVRPPVRYP